MRGLLLMFSLILLIKTVSLSQVLNQGSYQIQISISDYEEYDDEIKDYYSRYEKCIQRIEFDSILFKVTSRNIASNIHKYVYSKENNEMYWYNNRLKVIKGSNVNSICTLRLLQQKFIKDIIRQVNKDTLVNGFMCDVYLVKYDWAGEGLVYVTQEVNNLRSICNAGLSGFIVKDEIDAYNVNFVYEVVNFKESSYESIKELEPMIKLPYFSSLDIFHIYNLTLPFINKYLLDEI